MTLTNNLNIYPVFIGLYQYICFSPIINEQMNKVVIKSSSSNMYHIVSNYTFDWFQNWLVYGNLLAPKSLRVQPKRKCSRGTVTAGQSCRYDPHPTSVVILTFQPPSCPLKVLPPSPYIIFASKVHQPQLNISISSLQSFIFYP